MSFNSELKEELAHRFPEKDCCRIAELAALVKMKGSLRLSGGEGAGLVVESGSAGAARKVYRLAKELFGIELELVVEEDRVPVRHRDVSILCPDPAAAAELLRGLGLAAAGPRFGAPAGRIVRKKCCAAAYLRGALLAAGAVNDPHDGHHLELYSDDEEALEFAAALMRRLGLPARTTRRAKNSVAYLKGAEDIITLLALVGGHDAVLRMEDAGTMAGVRAEVNRLVNAEQYNLRKSAEAAVAQLEAISLIADEIGLDRLPAALREAALLRRARPRATLAELAEAADPPISKSALNHRLRRLMAMAAELKV